MNSAKSMLSLATTTTIVQAEGFVYLENRAHSKVPLYEVALLLDRWSKMQPESTFPRIVDAKGNLHAEAYNIVLTDFQIMHGLEPDRVVGRRTLRALEKEMHYLNNQTLAAPIKPCAPADLDFKKVLAKNASCPELEAFMHKVTNSEFAGVALSPKDQRLLEPFQSLRLSDHLRRQMTTVLEDYNTAMVSQHAQAERTTASWRQQLGKVLQWAGINSDEVITPSKTPTVAQVSSKLDTYKPGK